MVVHLWNLKKRQHLRRFNSFDEMQTSIRCCHCQSKHFKYKFQEKSSNHRNAIFVDQMLDVYAHVYLYLSESGRLNRSIDNFF